MDRRQQCQSLRTLWCQIHANDSPIEVVAASSHETGGLSAVDQTDHAVVTKQQRFGEITDARWFRFGMSAYRQQELVLCRRQPCLLSLFAAPVKKTPQRCAERKEPFVVGLLDFFS